MTNQLSLQTIQAGLAGQWHRADGVLSMYIYAPVFTNQKGPVEFTVPTEQGNAVSTWDYEVVLGDNGFMLHFTNRATQAVQSYRIDGLEKNKVLRLHSTEGYNLVFNAIASAS